MGGRLKLVLAVVQSFACSLQSWWCLSPAGCHTTSSLCASTSASTPARPESYRSLCGSGTPTVPSTRSSTGFSTRRSATVSATHCSEVAAYVDDRVTTSMLRSMSEPLANQTAWVVLFWIAIECVGAFLSRPNLIHWRFQVDSVYLHQFGLIVTSACCDKFLPTYVQRHMRFGQPEGGRKSHGPIILEDPRLAPTFHRSAPKEMTFFGFFIISVEYCV